MEKFLVDGRLTHGLAISQPEKGYRFSIDPFILAAHILPKGDEKIMDIGCGCGIIPLILARRYPGLKIYGVELQEELYTFAQQNIIANGFEKDIRVFHGDIRTFKFLETETKVDIVVSNPPYKKIGTGRISPDPKKATARHETDLDIDRLVECSGRLISDQGSLYVIFPFDRLSDLIMALSRHGFCPDFIRYIHINADKKAKRVVVHAVKPIGSKCSFRPPFFFYTPENKFTEEYLSLFRT